LKTKFEKLEGFQTVRSKLTVCPVIKQKVMVSPLTVGDDLHIRTMITSPELYDSELSIMIFNHCNFVDFPEIKYDDFINNISHSDRKMLLWAIYVSTYEHIKNASISCPKCSESFEQTIDVDKLLTDKTVKVWDKELDFNDFTVQQTFEISDGTSLVFYLKLPAIAEHLSLLGNLSVEALQENFKRFESVLSRVDELALCISKIELIDEDGTETFDTVNEVQTVLDKYVPIEQQDSIESLYDETFKDYTPVFTHHCTCPSCSNEFHFDIDIETILFKRFLNT